MVWNHKTKTIWKTTLPGRIISNPVIAGTSVYVGVDTGLVLGDQCCNGRPAGWGSTGSTWTGEWTRAGAPVSGTTATLTMTGANVRTPERRRARGGQPGAPHSKLAIWDGPVCPLLTPLAGSGRRIGESPVPHPAIRNRSTGHTTTYVCDAAVTTITAFPRGKQST